MQTTPTPPTVADLLDRFQVQCLPLLSPRTARDYARHLEHLKARFGDRIASELKPRDFGPFIQEKAGRRGEVQRVRQLAVLSAVFTQAVDIRALCATKCASPEIAMKLLGHTNLSMTLRVYRRGTERVKSLEVK